MAKGKGGGAGAGVQRFTIREKLLSIGQDFVIWDAAGAVAYKVDGKLLSIGDKLTMHDPQGQEVARIEQKMLSLVKAYRVKKGGEVVATVKKRAFSLLRDRFIIDVPGPDDLEVTGSLLDHDYTITRGRTTAATVSKKWLSVTDSYGVEVAEGEDVVLLLAAVIVVDLVMHDREGTRATST